MQLALVVGTLVATQKHLRFEGSKLMLVLTGSAVGVIERVLGPGGALRGRPTVSLRLDPLDVIKARAFLPRLAAPASRGAISVRRAAISALTSPSRALPSRSPQSSFAARNVDAASGSGTSSPKVS